MPHPSPSDPDDTPDRGDRRRRPRLSARELAALRRIEDDLVREDPGFTHRMRPADDHVTVLLPRSRRTLAIAAVVAVVLVVVLVPASWWVLYVLLALMGLATWVLVRGPGSGGPAGPGR